MISNLKKFLIIILTTMFLSCENEKERKIDKFLKELEKKYQTYNYYLEINEILNKDNKIIIHDDWNVYLDKNNIKRKIDSTLKELNSTFDSLLYYIDSIKNDKLEKFYYYARKLNMQKYFEFSKKKYSRKKQFDLFYFY